uniref:Integrase catalytic domain-containing protein n=1 Tax=Escherichia coli TaxID=562 RepID=A0A5B9SVB1_ECOLX|nr:hypothetical protein EC0638J-ColB-ColM_00131 [Escherichia coli]
MKESNQRWCSDKFEFRCDNGEKLRVAFALYVRHCTELSLRVASTVKQYRTSCREQWNAALAASFVNTIKRDYISIMPKPDGLTAAKNLAEAFEHHNEWHSHSVLGYRSPREYLRQRASNGLSDNRCLEI